VAGCEPIGQVTANTYSSFVCGVEDDSWQLLERNLKQQMRVVRRRLRAGQLRVPLAMIPDAD
jgi:hypothetical protein